MSTDTLSVAPLYFSPSLSKENLSHREVLDLKKLGCERTVCNGHKVYTYLEAINWDKVPAPTSQLGSSIQPH
jgi:hypothetical protein